MTIRTLLTIGLAAGALGALGCSGDEDGEAAAEGEGEGGASEDEPPPPACAAAGDCREGSCVGGECRSESVPFCADDADCEAGFRCRAGYCVFWGMCTQDSHCDAGDRCVWFRCRAASEPAPAPECGPDRGCDGGRRCVDGRCTDTPECRWDHHCGVGMACVDGACADRGCYPVDCPGGDCVAGGACVVAPPCEDYTDCPAIDQICLAERCVHRCDADTDCPPDGHCWRGECQRYVLDLSGDSPSAAGADAGPLFAGVAEVSADPPVGISMAGYGFRAGPSAPLNPYATSMGGCTGMFDRPLVKALVLDNGQERLAIVRLPTSWSTDFLRTAVVKEPLDRTGVSYEGRIVTTSTHTHSYPGRYWNLLPGLGFEAFGYGAFSAQWFTRLTGKVADAIQAAAGDLRPAAFAYTLDRYFDPDNDINRDRRGENGPFKDPRLLVLRVDDVSGAQPATMAVLVEFAMHGTINEASRLTGDAGLGVEMVLEEELEKREGSPVTVMFANGNAGDVSPDGDGFGHSDTARFEVLGHRTAAVVLPLLDAMEPARDVVLRQVDRRVPITREAIGYAPGEYYKARLNDWDEDAGPFKYGAFQCAQRGDDDPATTVTDGDLGCMFSVELVNNRRPVIQLSKTVISALRLGDLVVVTLPGESLSRLGEDLALEVGSRYGVADVSVWGYSQDHQLYLSTMDDWLQGGYEAAQGVWGFRFGEYLAREAAEAAGAVIDGADFRPPPSGVKPVWFSDLDPSGVPPQETEGTPGKVHTDVPAQVSRFELVRFSWEGGFPGVDLPRITLERKGADGSFAPLVWPAARPYTDTNFRMVLDYGGRWRTEHPWTVTWEENGDFPVGTYRFRVAGEHWTGEAAEAYEATSGEMEVVAWEGAPADPAWDPADGTFSGTLAYPPSGEESYRMRSLVTRYPGAGAPDAAGLDVRVVPAGGGDALAGAVATDASDPAALRVTFDGPDAAPARVRVEAADALGNRWSWETPE